MILGKMDKLINRQWMNEYTDNRTSQRMDRCIIIIIVKIFFSYIDSSSSYGADSEEDEDWAPTESNEDVEELVNDAKSFMSNKKMHRPM